MAAKGSGVSLGINFNGGGEVGKTFREALTPRTRSDSLSKRKRLEDEPSGSEEGGGERGSHEDRAFKQWKNITDWVEAVEVKSKELPTNEPVAIFLKDIIGGLKLILNDNAELDFYQAKKLDELTEAQLKQGIGFERIERVENVIERSKSTGGIITDQVERSAAYEKDCLELASANLTTKIFGVDLEAKQDDQDKIVTQAKLVMSNKSNGVRDMITKVRVVALGKVSSFRDNINTCPILCKSSSKANKAKLDKELKNAGFSVAYHWPKNAIDNINKIRAQLIKHKTTELDLTDKQIMIRPSQETGRNLFISYRAVGEKEWTLLERVRTPVEKKLLEKYSAKQLCTSKFFTLE
jgi:hypothetical protein